MKNHDLLKAAYAAFNRRDIDAALAVMHPKVEWANGMEGGTVRGHPAVREYWTRQWGIINPRVEPLNFEEDETGRVMVKVHQEVRDLQGTVIADRIVYHAYALRATWSKAWRLKSQVSKASRFTRGKPDSARPTSRPSCPTMLAARRGRAVA
jgi:hypothetical protein